MMPGHFRICDKDGTALNISDLLKVEHKGENVQPLDTKWDETIIAMQKHPCEELLEKLCFRQLAKPDQRSNKWLL